MCLEYRTPSGVSGLPCSVIKVNGKRQRPTQAKLPIAQTTSGMEVWITPTGRESQPAQLLAKGKGGPEGSYKHQLWPGDQFQK